MSVAHLADLGQQILRAIEGDQLKTKIAITHLEDVHRLLVQEHAERPSPRAPNPWQSPSPFDTPNAQRRRRDQAQFLWDEECVPAVVGPEHDQEMMYDASSIPFLYHQHP
jgi:hypothetical protein